MKPVPAETYLENLNWRYATKKFDATKKIPDAQWKALEQAMVLAPSSYGLQPLKFVVVTDAAVRAKLKAAAWNQPQVTEASHVVVFCRLLNPSAADVDAYMARIAEV
ncbi:MAG: nitroreductase family protein, partial [Planctomycetota bacterium]|nr:nitroreductase family protein [Planctomycetota bacterium]